MTRGAGTMRRHFSRQRTARKQSWIPHYVQLKIAQRILRAETKWSGPIVRVGYENSHGLRFCFCVLRRKNLMRKALGAWRQQRRVSLKQTGNGGLLPVSVTWLVRRRCANKYILGLVVLMAWEGDLIPERLIQGPRGLEGVPHWGQLRGTPLKLKTSTSMSKCFLHALIFPYFRSDSAFLK